MPANLPITVGTAVDADLLNEISGISESASFISVTSLSPLTSTAGVKAAILSGSFSFTSGYAYEITIQCRWSVAGTPTLSAEPMALFGVTRAAASGTAIFNTAYLSPPASGVSTHMMGSQIVKCTAGDTTQTLVFCAEFSAAASGTSMAVGPNGTVSPSRMTIKRIGLSANHNDAIEIPTT
jgi:hypothetical protein